MWWTVIHIYVWRTGACIAKVIFWEPDFWSKMENKGEGIIASQQQKRQTKHGRGIPSLDWRERCTEVFYRRAYELKGLAAEGLPVLRALYRWEGSYRLFCHLSAMLNILHVFAFMDLPSHFLELFWLFCDCCVNYSPSNEVTGRYNMPLQKQGTHGIFIDLVWLVKAALNCCYILGCEF